MKLIVGLGNPGEKYQNNRHNIGFLVIDKLKNLITNYQSPIIKQIRIFKSQNYMNESGEFVKKLVDRYRIDLADLRVIHDDLDLALGTYKIQFGKGPKDHKGLNDIYARLGTRDFWHIRIGVDNRSPDNRISGEEYVLQDFTDEEKVVLKKVINAVCKKLATS